MAAHAGDPAEAGADPLVGARLQKYEIRKLIGAGGMGRVYEAWNPSIGKRVAIKVLAEDVARHADAAARFQREARAASAVESPFIVDIFDAGQTDDGRPFIVMELLRGEPFSSVIARQTQLDPSEVVRVVSHVLRGLERAHAAGIVHRDLKPDNIFLVDADPDPPRATILDFGVSKFGLPGAETTLTREGSVLGTPAYMSPEQAQGESEVDARSDLWSVGAILYQCLTGRQPFVGATYEQIIVRICSTQPIALRTLAPDCPEALAVTVERCLEKDRDKRFGSAAEVLAALDQPSAGLPKSRPAPARARDTTTVGSASTIRADGSRRAGRRRWLFGTAVAGVLAAMTLISFRLLDAPAPGRGTATAPSSAAAPPQPSVASVAALTASTSAATEPTARAQPAETAALASASATPSAGRPVREPVLTRATAKASAPAVSTETATTAPPSKGVAGGLVIQPR